MNINFECIQLQLEFKVPCMLEVLEEQSVTNLGRLWKQMILLKKKTFKLLNGEMGTRLMIIWIFIPVSWYQIYKILLLRFFIVKGNCKYTSHFFFYPRKFILWWYPASASENCWYNTKSLGIWPKYVFICLYSKSTKGEQNWKMTQ